MPSGWNNFLKHTRKELHEIPYRECQKIAGQRWRNLTPEEKDKFMDTALTDALERLDLNHMPSKVLVFDIETTGLPIRKDYDQYHDYKELIHYQGSRVVQLGCILYSNEGDILEEKEWIFKPDGYIIPEESTKIHGITTEKALETFTPVTDIVDEWKQMFNQAKVLVAHNASFDKNILASEFYRQGYEEVAKSLADSDMFCTMDKGKKITKLRGKHGYKFPKLSELYQKLFDEGIEAQHTAKADAKACGRCYFKMTEK
jgi:DNA polymerase III subunit epsilon